MPKITIRRGNLGGDEAEHDSWARHRLAYNMGLWDFSYVYAVNTMNIDQTIDGVKTFLNFPVFPVGFPVEDNQAVNKVYADYIARTSVTFENLYANGDVGTGADQVAQGDHTHANLPTDDQKDALDTAQDPSAGNPFVTFNQFADHHVRHEANGPDEISLSGLSGGPVTINGVIFTVTVVNTTPYVVLNTDVHLSVNTVSSVKTINLPAITADNNGQRYIIKDALGNAGVNNITVTPNGTNQIDNGGAGTAFTMIADNEVIELISNNSTKNWELSADRGKFKIIETSSVINLSLIPADEVVVVCDTTTGGFFVNLPAIAVVRARVVYSIVNISSNNNDVTVDAFGTETIDGELTQEVTDASSIRIIPTINGWFIL